MNHRAFIVENFFKNNESIVVTQRQFRTRFNLNSPCRNTILKWVGQFRTTASALKKKPTGRPISVRTPANIERVQVAFLRSPKRSANRQSQTLAISRTSLQRILHKDLSLKPYKVQLVQELKDTDFAARLAFSNNFLDLLENNADLSENLFTSDEAHFHMCGYVNKQNSRYWSQENPKEIHQTPLHSQKVTVWCAVSAQGIVGPYFFEDENEENTTVNSVRYVNMLETFFQQELRRFPENMWFQQDGATCHTARASMNVLRQMFPGRLISRFGDLQWPPRSCDLTPCDFWLWGYLKSRVYINNPQNIHELKENIRTEIRNISPLMLHNAMRNMVSRVEECSRREGHHLLDTIFKN